MELLLAILRLFAVWLLDVVQKVQPVLVSRCGPNVLGLRWIDPRCVFNPLFRPIHVWPPPGCQTVFSLRRPRSKLVRFTKTELGYSRFGGMSG